MQKKKIQISLNNPNSIRDTIKYFENYKKELQNKSQLFVQKLADRGISVAYQVMGSDGTFGSHKMENYVMFTTSVNHANADGCQGYLIGIGQTFMSGYQDENGNVIYNVIKPLSMLEFGSAGKALPPQDRFGGSGGKGTMTKQGHEDDTVWFFKDEEGNVRMGTAITPTQPMYNAWKTMYDSIADVINEVYGNG